MNKKSWLRWRCRRGIREMDIVLQTFLEQCYDTLSDIDKQSFTALLDETDLDIMNWMMGKDEPENNALKKMIFLIQQSRQLN